MKKEMSPMSHRAKKGFTLIELLVVIAIIAILAAILFPVFARARENARRSSCLSNMKQMGIGIMQYTQDYDEKFPQAYWYPNDTDGTGGYMHWSGNVQPYVKSEQIFVCPSDATGGLAQTNFIGDNGGFGFAPGQTAQTATVQDNQAHRLSYTANEALIARKRKTADPEAAVSIAAVDNVATTILVAELTSKASCINDESTASGIAFKSHRPTIGFKVGASGVFDGEKTTTTGSTDIRAITLADAQGAINACNTSSASGQHHIAYVAQERHLDGNNYMFADGHAKWYKLGQTLNPNNFLWGKRSYSTGGQVVTTDGTNPVG